VGVLNTELANVPGNTVDPSIYGPASQLVAPSPVDIPIANTGAGIVLVATVPIPVGNNRLFDLHFWYSIADENMAGTGTHMAVSLVRDSAGTLRVLTGGPGLFGTTSFGLKLSVGTNTDDIAASIAFASAGETEGDMRYMLFERSIPNVVVPTP
jgi:hypothetical protein